MPAMTVANLFAWFTQVAVLTVAAGVATRGAAAHSPRMRLACFRALLVVCLTLPFAAMVPSQESDVSTRGERSAVANGRQAGIAPSLLVDVTPGGTAEKHRAPQTTSSAASRLGNLAPGWIVPVLFVVLAVGTAIRLAWLSAGLMALRRLRRQAGPEMQGPEMQGPEMQGPEMQGPEMQGPELKLGAYDHQGRIALHLRNVGPRLQPGAYAGHAEGGAIASAIALTGVRACICTSQAVAHPVTFGVVRPIILLPSDYASLDESQQLAVVCHELLHVRRCDWLHTIGEEIVRAVFWFHPAIWWLLAQMDLSREQVVDQAVVALTERRQPYVNALVALARTPAGPILRPASLFLGRAHLLQRVALLSREVRMSRPRLVVSVVLIAAALVFGGQFVVRAFPLSLRAVPAPAATPPAPAPAVQQTVPPRVPPPPPQLRTTARILQRAEPVLTAQPGQFGDDTIVAMHVTVQPTGEVTREGAVEALATERGRVVFQMAAAEVDNVDAAFVASHATVQSSDAAGAAHFDALRSAFDAVRMWRFEPAPQPFTTVVGFNLTRTEQSGVETEPVRIGHDLKMPVKVRDVKPVYPDEAQARGIQGVVILELDIDGAGIPVSAFALRPVEGLTMAAVQAALQWRFTPDANYSRRLMTVTVNFTLAGSSTGAVGGVSGGVVGGVPGGVSGGVAGGVVGGAPSAGTAPLRVGGNTRQPVRIKYVEPVYPQIAQQAGVRGVVILEVVIGADGKVQEARILRSIPLLDQAAIDAVKQWEYRPTLLNGTPVPVVMTVTASFPGSEGAAYGAVSGGAVGGVVGGVPTGVAGGVSGGVSGGVAGGVAGAVSSTGMAPVRVGGNIKPPTRIKNVEAVYPQLAQDARVQGVVILEIVIGADGKVQEAKILRSIPLLDQAAIDAAKQWEYTPTLLNGTPVPVIMTVTVNFTLM